MTEFHEAHHPINRHALTAHHWRWAMPLAAVLLGLTVGSGILLAIQASWQNQRAHPPLPAYGRVLGPKAVAQTDLYRMSVTSAVTTVTSDPAFTPPADQNLVVLAISVTNTGKLTHPFYPSLQTYIRDDEGQSYPLHPSIGVTNPLPAGDLAPGQTASGQLSYAIPVNLKNFRLYIDPVWAGMTPVVFNLSR